MSHANHDHNHAHSHSHDHSGGGGHCHAPKVNAKNRKRVGWAAVLTGLFMLVEVAGGLISGSLALLADAGHMLTDFAALGMAWGAFWVAQRPANKAYTFGYDRAAILVAFINGATLFALAIWILYEAAQRAMNPGEVLAGPMLLVAILGLAVNILVFFVLRGADQHNLNVRGAVLHVLGDMLGSAAAILAAIIILATGWMPADPLLSVVVALLILRAAWRLIKDSAHVLMEGAPRGFSAEAVRADLLANVEGLQSAEDIRAWSLTTERPMLTLRGAVSENAEIEAVRSAIKLRLSQGFKIDEATVELSKPR